MAEIPEDRDLTAEERALVEWLLRHGVDGAWSYADQLPGLRVVSRCGCGCGCIDFPGWNHNGGYEELADYQYDGPDGERFGVVLFAHGSQLASLEVWPITGSVAPASLPAIEQLRPTEWADGLGGTYSLDQRHSGDDQI